MALRCLDLGGPEVLQVIDLPEVHAGAGQVRIRNQAATVNPTDTLLCSGARAEQMKAGPPFYVPGTEAAGIVDEVGPGVATGIKPGDAALVIMFPKASQGAYREQLVLDARSVVPAPAGKSHAEAMTLPMNGLTARGLRKSRKCRMLVISANATFSTLTAKRTLPKKPTSPTCRRPRPTGLFIVRSADPKPDQQEGESDH
jgi:NADPH:quinone reductase-like Zn-dependent oxidoreductase